MAKDIKEVLDEIDAAVFSGDSFLDPDNLEAFKKYLARWNRAIPGFEACIAEISGAEAAATAAEITESIDDFIIDFQGAKEVKVDTYIANFFGAECATDFDEDDVDEDDVDKNSDTLIFTFGIENGDLIFSEKNIVSIAKICNRQWSLVIDVDGKSTSVIFTFLI